MEELQSTKSPIDPLMSECLIYYLNPGKNSVGREEAKEEHEIVLSGLGILENHCELNNSDGKVAITPAPEALVFVNGVLISTETNLSHGDRVILGNNHTFRFHNPLQPEDPAKKRAAVVDWRFAQNELAEKQVFLFLFLFAFFVFPFFVSFSFSFSFSLITFLEKNKNKKQKTKNKKKKTKNKKKKTKNNQSSINISSMGSPEPQQANLKDQVVRGS